MPDLNPQYAQFQKEIEAMIKELLTTLKKTKFSDMELAQLAAEINFFDEIKKLGFEDIVEKYLGTYETKFAELLATAKTAGVDFAKINTELLERITILDKEYLLGKASSWGKQFDSQFVKSVIRGDTIPQTIANLSEIPLTDSQLGTVLNTSYSDFNRTAIKEIYKDIPDQRFSYEGGVIPTSSDQCRWLMENQNPEGYTAAEFDAGIYTPFGMIYFSGRDPNYNCGHTPEPIITEFK